MDAARAVALVGMMATHLLLLEDDDGRPTVVGVLFDGRASALFAVLAGVSIALMTGGPARPERFGPPAVALAVRALLIGLIGLALGGLDPPVAVILAYYGLLFLAAIPLLRLRTPALAALAVAVAALAPVLSQAVRAGLPPGPGDQASLSSLADPAGLLVTLGLTGYYPALPWLAYLLAGLAAGRADLTRARTAAVLAGLGAALTTGAALASAALLEAGGAAVLGDALEERRYGTTPTGTWWWLATDLPHSGTPLDLAGTIGSALLVLGTLLLVARLGRAGAVLLWIPAAVGSMPLTLYTQHVLVVTALPDSPLAAHVAVAVVFGSTLRVAGLRGPLEATVGAASRTAAATLTRREWTAPP